MNPQHNATSPADIDAEKRASTHAQIEHARARTASQDEHERRAAAEEFEANARTSAEAGILRDANADARAIRAMLPHRDPSAVVSKMLAAGPVQALRVALALATLRIEPHLLFGLRIALDAQAEDMESAHLHAEECRKICENISDRLSTTDETLESIMAGMRDQLSEIGYAVDHPEDFDAEPPTE